MKSLDISDAITIAREIMKRLFTEGKKDQCRGAEKVWSALIRAGWAAHEPRF